MASSADCSNLQLFSANFSGSDDFCSLVHGMETVLYSLLFYVIFKFCAQVKFATLDGNVAYVAKEE